VTIVQPGTISTQPQPVDAGAAEPASASDQPVTTNVCQSPFAAPTRGGSNEGGTGVTISVPSQTKGADAGTGGTGSTTPPSPTVPATDDSNTGTASGAKTGGGCSVAGSSSPSALWLGLVGLFALRSLRRKRTR
jgi:MYXO-CTERM domain-containing protein